MTTEYGIFNDEGCIEAQLYSEESARIARAQYYIEGEVDLRIETICPEHEEQPAEDCEECNAACVICGGVARDVPTEEADDAICADCGLNALERTAS